MALRLLRGGRHDANEPAGPSVGSAHGADGSAGAHATGRRRARTRAEAERLVRDYADLIGRLAYTYLRSRADAEDIAQDVLLKLLTGRRGFVDAEHERSWVVAVTRNACLDLLRSARWRTTVALDEATEPTEPWVGPDEDADVLDAVNRLPLAYREAIYLHYFEGYPIARIAEDTHESVAAVTKRLSRARAMLKERLGGNDG